MDAWGCPNMRRVHRKAIRKASVNQTLWAGFLIKESNEGWLSWFFFPLTFLGQAVPKDVFEVGKSRIIDKNARLDQGGRGFLQFDVGKMLWGNTHLDGEQETLKIGLRWLWTSNTEQHHVRHLNQHWSDDPEVPLLGTSWREMRAWNTEIQSLMLTLIQTP